MPKICLVFWKYEPHYAYKRYAYKKDVFNTKSFRYLQMHETHFESNNTPYSPLQ